MSARLIARMTHRLPTKWRSALLRVPGAVQVYHLLSPQSHTRITKAIRDLQQLREDLGLAEVRLSGTGAFFVAPTGAEFGYVPNWGAYGAEYGSIHEQAEVEYAAEHVPTGGLVFDVGANIGTFCINLAVLRPDLTIHAFEPVRSTYSWLVTNINRNGLEARVFPHQLALLDRSMAVTITAGNYTDNRLTRDVADGTESVSGHALDDLVGALGSPALIKVDVEGAELLVLRGAQGVLQNARPALILEVYRPHLEAFGYDVPALEMYLSSLGYSRTESTSFEPVNILYTHVGALSGSR
jgi:FkbM family methyltransferase